MLRSAVSPFCYASSTRSVCECARVFAANIKFINWMLCIRNCEAFEHYNGDLTQLFIIVAFQWLALLCSLFVNTTSPRKRHVGSQIDVAVAVIVRGTDFEIELCTNFRVLLQHRFEMNVLLCRMRWWRHKRPSGYLNAIVAEEIAKPIWYISLSTFLTLSFICGCNSISFSLHFLDPIRTHARARERASTKERRRRCYVTRIYDVLFIVLLPCTTIPRFNNFSLSAQ